MVTISTRIRQLPTLLDICAAHDNIYCSVGTHPHNADEERGIPADEIVRLSAASEGGRHRRSRARLLLQARLARGAGGRLPPPHRGGARTGLPLEIHTRDADDDTLAILEDEHARNGAFPAILHCYTGGPKLARRAVELGLYVSFTGVVTFKKSEALRDIARDVPLDRLLVETDAPYLAPEPYRGKTNEPSYVVHTAATLAKVKGVSPQELASATTDNFFRLFRKVKRPAAARHCRRMSYRATILGCGSSGGVPRIGTMWGACDPTNPKNRRRRCSALIERIGKPRHTTVLIDTSPDLREQLLSVRCEALDGVLYTHDHADHTHGIDDLRMVAYAMKKRLDVWVDEPTRASLVERFAYCFEQPPGSSYPPILRTHEIDARSPIRVDGPSGVIEAVPIPQLHGDIGTLGFRVGGLAYSPDISDIPVASLPLLQNLDVWIVDALRFTPHPSHFSVKQALAWIKRLAPKRAILTHMTTDLDYEALRRELPAGSSPPTTTWSSTSIEPWMPVVLRMWQHARPSSRPAPG